MLKTRILVVCLLGFLIFPLSAQKFFAGAQGDFALPAVSQGDSLYGFGGGFTLEGGMYLGNCSLGLTARFAHSGDEGSLIQEMTDFLVGPEVGYSLGKDLVSFFPEWLCIRGNLSLLADIYKVEGYRSKSKKEAGKKESSTGCAFAFETGICVDLENLLEYKGLEFIPTLGYFETFCLEDDGLIFSGRISLGMRVLFP